MRAILTDIEGTISSVTYVRDVMFPYARAQIGDFLAKNADKDGVAALIAETKDLAELPHDAPLSSAVAALQSWIDVDRKAPPLKALQGMIWKTGFETGELVSELYPDALKALRDWKAQGLPIHVYSSGSVEAQDLFFAYTKDGDLRPLFDGHYDTRSGQKDAPESYTNIAQTMGLLPTDILFLSDSPVEWHAALKAGMQVVGVDRDGLGTVSEAPNGITVVSTFDEITDRA